MYPFRKENGWELWPRGIVPSGCQLVTNGFHVCKEDRSEHYTLETLDEAEDLLISLGGGIKFAVGKTRIDGLTVQEKDAPLRGQSSERVGVAKENRKEKRPDVIAKPDDKKVVLVTKGPPEKLKIKDK